MAFFTENVRRGAGAVSYTHLDVYKRQGLIRSRVLDVVLQGIGLPVVAPLAEQLLMGAPFGDPAVLEHQDLVGILDRGDPLGDEDFCTGEGQPPELVLYV